MVERRLVAIRGVVQGVGFRPYLQGLAATCELRGQTWNDCTGLMVDLEGEGDALDRFLSTVRTAPPPLAVVESVSVEHATPAAYPDFRVAPSDTRGTVTAQVAADAATCDACVAELFAPAGRRYRHPFISCTNCGPRFTIVHAVPYDRARTTMAGFAMCAACRAEYADPADRRFHAQPIACASCGPSLLFHADAQTPAAATDDRTTGATGAATTASARGEEALQCTVAMIAAGCIAAVKGLGGYHLCCDARSDAAVRRLRQRKHREAKPLAVMVWDLDAARALAHVDDSEAALLRSPTRPIVLLRSRADAPLAPSVAPEFDTVGVMLAYTPLHHLLLADLDRPLVMTSGNRSDEPIAYDDDGARVQLRGIADCFLGHDRAIAVRCDDSVVRVLAGAPSVLRRSRGLAPGAIRLSRPVATPVLALGGHLKNTFCLARGDQAVLSQHIGDLDHPAAREALRDGIAHLQRLHGIAPELVAHDLHPDYGSTRLAHTFDLPMVAVQHHHAHVAACAAEHGIHEPVLGVAFDGSGAGTDGAVWGGEFLLVDGGSCARLAHLGYVPLPGGEAAVREPWRMAVSHLTHAYGDSLEAMALPLLDRHADALAPLRQMLASGFRAPPTSSVGRLFDAVAALLDVRDHAAYEAQAAIGLETLAARDCVASYAPELNAIGDLLVADPGALIRGVVSDLRRGLNRAQIAGAFHNGVRDMVVAVIANLVARTGVRRVVLTGGVFQNALLLERVAGALSARGLEVLAHRRVPANDGGLALGQAVVAAALGAACSPATTFSVAGG